MQLKLTETSNVTSFLNPRLFALRTRTSNVCDITGKLLFDIVVPLGLILNTSMINSKHFCSSP